MVQNAPLVAEVTSRPLAVAAGTTASKTAAFVRCIFLIGVPIGVAWEIAFNPAVAAWVAGRGPLPATIGATVARYVGWVKSSCGYALR